jgi:hypothetical protein
MSKHETAMTEGFWLSGGKGAYIAEYPLVRKAADRSGRWADAVILPDEGACRARVFDYPNLDGRNVIVVQTKVGRMGMYLMGQALFSARLVMAQRAKSVRSILLCHRPDGALLPLLRPFPEIEVWVSDPADSLKCSHIPV